MKSLFERLRTRRLASMFILLGTLSVAIVAALMRRTEYAGKRSRMTAPMPRLCGSPIPRGAQ